MDDIAGDAELQEKSVADLKKLGERRVADCKDCVRESAENKKRTSWKVRDKALKNSMDTQRT